MKKDYINILSEFLNTPLDSGDEIFAKFSSLPGAVVGVGEKPLQRFVYVPGNRKDRVLLCAHIDTVWDKAYKKPFSDERTVIFEDGIFKSNNPDCGIGADDHAGCAMLWALRENGHSILITDGEEFGKIGAKYLKNSHQKLYRELNRHRYMLALDWKGTDCCLFNQVDNTAKFKKYIECDLGFVDSKTDGGCDLQILCKHVCGANLGVGYHGWHKASETLVLSEWENTFDKLTVFLENPQPRFRSRILLKYIRLAKICVNKALRILKLKK